MSALLAHPKLKRVRKFLSTSFHEPVGQRIATGEGGTVEGYYVDLGAKAKRPDWPAAWPFEVGRHPWVALSQLALGAHERFLAGEGEEWLGLARTVGDLLVDNQVRSGGPRDGALEHHYDFPHTFSLQAPWISAMAQGQAASLFVRLHARTGEERWSEAALRALGPMSIPTGEGGASAPLGGRPLPEEYPTEPPSFVLNGGIFAIWGWYDVARGLGDSGAAAAFESAVDTLAANIRLWDTGWWSRYDLHPHPVANLASFAYHELHINQLRAMELIAPRPELIAAAERFEGYASSRLARGRAFGTKVAFRLRVPRNRGAASCDD
jgi:hypothetical protein